MLFNIRTAADIRAALYALLPIVSTLLVTYGVVDEAKAALWAGVVTAILGPVIAAVQARTVSSLRTAFYAFAAAVQAVVVGYGLVTDAQIGVWMPLITALVGATAGGVAVANVDTSPARPAGSVIDPAPVAKEAPVVPPNSVTITTGTARETPNA